MQGFFQTNQIIIILNRRPSDGTSYSGYSSTNESKMAFDCFLRFNGSMKHYIDLFCGAGGLSLGIEQAGFKLAFASDFDPVCSNTYKKNRNLTDGKFFIGDIRALNKDKGSLVNKGFQGIDLVAGGPPCQGFSMANRQRVINDPRNVLYKEYLSFLSYIKPKFFIMENVKGMLKKMPEILDDFENLLGKIYNVSYSLFNAKDFGVPQNRERLIIIGNRLGISSKEVIDNIKKNSLSSKKFVLFDAIGDLPELKPNRQKNATHVENDDIGYFKRPFIFQHTSFYKFINGKRTIEFLYNHKNRYNNDRDIEIYTRLPQGGNSLDSTIADIMPYKNRLDIFKDKYYKLRYDEVCKTITSHMMFDCNMYIHPTQARGLSPREAARIQTFPDDYVFYGSQNLWYKQIGNAVPVKMAEAIAKEIYKHL